MPCLCELASDAEDETNETEITIMNGQNNHSFFSIICTYVAMVLYVARVFCMIMQACIHIKIY